MKPTKDRQEKNEKETKENVKIFQDYLDTDSLVSLRSSTLSKRTVVSV